MPKNKVPVEIEAFLNGGLTGVSDAAIELEPFVVKPRAERMARSKRRRDHRDHLKVSPKIAEHAARLNLVREAEGHGVIVEETIGAKREIGLAQYQKLRDAGQIVQKLLKRGDHTNVAETARRLAREGKRRKHGAPELA